MDKWGVHIGTGGLRYRILDPTGNITALVESDVQIAEQPAVAKRIMRRHPEVEQVGFVSQTGEGPSGKAPTVCLRMAGGEFCGNATMSAAALWLMSHAGSGVLGTGDSKGAQKSVSVQVWGIDTPIKVLLRRQDSGCYLGGVRMPATHGVELRHLVAGALAGMLPLVRMEGISHVVIEPDSPFAQLSVDRVAAERAVRAWCAELAADSLGLMFLDRDAHGHALTPLVYVPGSDTVFWENSCASGTSAVGIYLAWKAGAAVDVTLRELGGTLRVTSDPARGETWLYGSVRAFGG